MVEISPTGPVLAARILELIAGGQATSRSEICLQLGVAPSTVSLTVHQLLDQGLVAENGTQASTGGRPRKVLQIGGGNGFAVAADLGGSHSRVGVVHAGGRISNVSTMPFPMGEGPERGLERLAATLSELASRQPDGVLRGVGVSLPGPVDVSLGAVILPSRMPGWRGFPVRAWLEDRFGVTVGIDNDANLMALGEHSVRPRGVQQSITVKAGTAIGVGVVVGGALYRGATGAAGDITHARLPAAGDRPCGCGNTGCLETIASGAALVRQLRGTQGRSVETINDVVTLAERGEPEATQAIRQAGRLLGEVLSTTVNFFNPDAVYLGGILSTVEPYVAAVRSQLYEGCHPLATKNILIEKTRTGANAGLLGAGLYALNRSFADALEMTVQSSALAHRISKHR